MTWIRVSVGICDSPKIDAFAEALGKDTTAALGYYLRLVTHVAQHAADGNLTSIPANTIEQTWCRWKGARGKLYNAVRLALCDEDGALYDWEEENGQWLRAQDQQRAANRERQRTKRQRDAERQQAEPAPFPATRNGDVTRDNRVTVTQYRDATSLASHGTTDARNGRTDERGEPTNAKDSNSSTRTDEDAAFERAWEDYPRREGSNSKRDAFEAWRAQLLGGATTAEMHAGVRRYANYIRAIGREHSRYVKQASRFFGPGAHWREAWNPPTVSENRSQARAAATVDEIREWIADGE